MNSKVYLLIGIFGATIVPILDFFFERNLVMESEKLWLYITCHVLLIFVNGTLHLAVFAFFDNARVDLKRREYLMKMLTSTI